MTPALSRREFLGTSGLALAVTALPARRLAGMPVPVSAARALAPSAFVEITPDGVVSVWVTKSDMGQGVRTALPMILADELEADWSKVRVVQADAHPRYGEMGTGGSSSVGSLWEPLRKAGLVISALTQREHLTEIVELPQSVHPWFVGVQFHPEFKSTPWDGHPLFNAFIKAAVDHQAAGKSLKAVA